MVEVVAFAGFDYLVFDTEHAPLTFETVQSLMQVGIRSLRNPRVQMEDTLADGNQVVTMEEFYDRGSRGLVEGLPANSRVYVSLDIDVLDLPLVPGCVSAEPNGMTYAELRDTLFALAEHTDIIGFDLVEVNPQLDVGTGITSYLAAHTVLEFLGRICDQPRWKQLHHTLPASSAAAGSN